MSNSTYPNMMFSLKPDLLAFFYKTFYKTINDNSILSVAQAKIMESSLTPLLLSHSICNLPANLVDSTFKLYPESEHFSPTLVLPPWLKTQSPSSWIVANSLFTGCLDSALSPFNDSTQGDSVKP